MVWLLEVDINRSALYCYPHTETISCICDNIQCESLISSLYLLEGFPFMYPIDHIVFYYVTTTTALAEMAHIILLVLLCL